MNVLEELQPKVSAGEPLSRADAERVLACPDLVSVGALAEGARVARHGDHVTFVQVLTVDSGTAPATVGAAQEVRIVNVPSSVEAACALVRDVARLAGSVPVTGFSAADVLALAGGDLVALSEAARRLREAGLADVAFMPVDLMEEPAPVVRTLRDAGLPVRRATVDRAATPAERLACIERVAALERELPGLRAFAPLPRFDDAETPSTGYDDVRTVAVARLVCAGVPSIQVDWAAYGPKLAQVAIAYGADDIDNVPALDADELGPRRSPGADVARQIGAAFAAPRARNGRFEPVP